MDNNLPIRFKKPGFIEKIINYFRNKFLRKEEKTVINNSVLPGTNDNNTEFIKNLSTSQNTDEVIKAFNRNNKVEEIISIIEKYPETLEKLDIPQLQIIDNYYKEKIAMLKKQSNGI